MARTPRSAALTPLAPTSGALCASAGTQPRCPAPPADWNGACLLTVTLSLPFGLARGVAKSGGAGGRTNNHGAGRRRACHSYACGVFSWHCLAFYRAILRRTRLSRRHASYAEEHTHSINTALRTLAPLPRTCLSNGRGIHCCLPRFNGYYRFATDVYAHHKRNRHLADFIMVVVLRSNIRICAISRGGLDSRFALSLTRCAEPHTVWYSMRRAYHAQV